MVFSIILSIFAEIFDESLESEVGMGANIERDKLKTRKDTLAGYFFDISKLSFGAMVFCEVHEQIPPFLYKICKLHFDSIVL